MCVLPEADRTQRRTFAVGFEIHTSSVSLLPAVMSTETASDRLKAEGNAYYAQRKYEAAYAKYTAAIEVTMEENAILFANRSACSLAMKK